MAAEPKPGMKQDAAQEEPDRRARRTFKDYAQIAWAKAMDPRALPSIGRELAYAVTDIRQKVVEEGMYGKAVTPQEDWPDEKRQNTVEAKKPEATPEGDPLGRTSGDGESKFKQRCREAFENGGGKGPEDPDRGPERGPER